MGDGTNGDPFGLVHARCVRVTLPRPPGRIASVGPTRPDDANTRPWPTTGVGMTSNELPSQTHNSLPFAGSYAVTAAWLLTMISSCVPTRTATGVPQPTDARRGVRQRSLPVRESNAATNDPPSKS